MLRHVDLCSGIGGFALGFQWAELSKPVLFCDIEPWSRKVLRKHWPDVPIAEDVKELANDPDGLVPDCSIITAGYPCQPFSVAGDRRGQEDDRHIWPEIFTIIKAKRPTWTVFENVYGHVSMGLDEVLSDLEGASYSVRPFVVPACAVDAPHRRDRVWIIARNVGNTQHNGSPSPTLQRSTEEASDNNTEGQIKTGQSEGASQSRNSEGMEASTRADNVAYSNSARLQGRKNARDVSEGRTQRDKQSPRRSERSDGQNWLLEPPVGRVAHGIPRRVDRLRGLGNAIVPQIAQRIGETIKQCS